MCVWTYEMSEKEKLNNLLLLASHTIHCFDFSLCVCAMMNELCQRMGRVCVCVRKCCTIYMCMGLTLTGGGCSTLATLMLIEWCLDRCAIVFFYFLSRLFGFPYEMNIKLKIYSKQHVSFCLAESGYCLFARFTILQTKYFSSVDKFCLVQLKQQVY